MTTLCALALDVLQTANAIDKARLSRVAAEKWRADPTMPIGAVSPPDFPARPEKPETISATKIPRRRGHSAEARSALLHAVLHIELNAIDLAWDIIARFTAEGFPREFYDDWVKVADEEGKHFLILAKRIDELGFAYGDFPAHGGLWEAAYDTRNDIAARLAVVPMVLEARGLDVTPGMINRFDRIGDPLSADVLKIILEDEIGHVAIGNRWFQFIAKKQNKDPKEFWHKMVRENFRGLLKPPFNEEARRLAAMPPEFYMALTKR
ncbi:MAG: ferritin-like domain-containing protein [Sneathiella sp.]